MSDDDEKPRNPFPELHIDPFLSREPPPGTRILPPSTPRKYVPRAAAPDSSADRDAAGAAVSGELVDRGAFQSQADFYRNKRRQERQAARIARIARVDADIRRQASQILLDTFAASEIPDSGERPEGWSDKKWRTARDARQSHREAPTYIQHAARMVESFRRSEALEKEGAPAPVLNCEIQVNVSNQYTYETIEQKGE